MRVRQRIVHLVALALCPHNSALAQQGQVLAHFRLSLAKLRDEVFDRLGPLPQQGKHFQSRLIGQGLAQLGLHAIQLLFLCSVHGFVHLSDTFNLSNSRMLSCPVSTVKQAESQFTIVLVHRALRRFVTRPLPEQIPPIVTFL